MSSIYRIDQQIRELQQALNEASCVARGSNVTGNDPNDSRSQVETLARRIEELRRERDALGSGTDSGGSSSGGCRIS